MVSPTNPPSVKNSWSMILNFRWVNCFQSVNGKSNLNFSFHHVFSSLPESWNWVTKVLEQTSRRSSRYQPSKLKGRVWTWWCFAFVHVRSTLYDDMIDWWTCNQGETEMLMGSNQVKMKEGIYMQKTSTGAAAYRTASKHHTLCGLYIARRGRVTDEICVLHAFSMNKKYFKDSSFHLCTGTPFVSVGVRLHLYVLVQYRETVCFHI
jgi:hypothetical protein